MSDFLRERASPPAEDYHERQARLVPWARRWQCLERMKILIPGGRGQIGRILARAFQAKGHEVVILGRSGGGVVRWDGRTLAPDVVEGVDVVVNLAGRSVNCRYTPRNLDEMMRSRVESTRAVGTAIAGAERPPRVWLQMSTATIYAHRFDAQNDEVTGILSGGEPGAPAYWAYSIEIAKAWEKALADADTPNTRRVALRSAMVMSPDEGGIFDTLLRLTRLGLGGPVGGGAQYVSFIHEQDFVRAVEFLIDTNITGPVNLAAPYSLPQRDLMTALRAAAGVRVGLPATKWMAEIGAFFLRTDTELLLKSRRVSPGRLLEAGFRFDYPRWREAAEELVARRRTWKT